MLALRDHCYNLEIVSEYRLLLYKYHLYSSPTPDKTKDPNESLMEMMKKMYDEGDDEMKRSISKAWTQSRDKTGGPAGAEMGGMGGDMGGMPGMGGMGMGGMPGMGGGF